MRTSTVVVNYRTPWDLRTFLDSFDGEELIIVNVAAEPDDIKVANGYDQIDTIVINFEDNVGYARAVNRGCAMARGDVFAIFNADVQLRPGVLTSCSELLASNDAWGILGPLQVDRQGLCTHPGIFGTHRQPQWRSGGWKARVQPAWREIRDDAVTVMGSAYFIKANVWDELLMCPIYQQFCRKHELVCDGAFLPTQFYYEETACSYHAAAHGFKVVFDGTHEIIHDWHGAIKAHNLDDWAAKQFSKSQKLFRIFCEEHGIEHD